MVQLGLDLLAVFTDLANVLLVVFGFLLLFDAGDDAPRRTSCTDNVLVGTDNRLRSSTVSSPPSFATSFI